MNNTSTMDESGKDTEKCDESMNCITMDKAFLNDLLECSVCLEQLDSTSKVLPCQHTFCKRCLHEILNLNKELRCPECRKLVDIEIEELPCNVLVERLLEGMKNNVRPKRAGSTLEDARTPSATDLRMVPTQDPNYTLCRTITGHKGAIYSVKFSPSGDFLASCSYDKEIKIWSSHDGELQDTLVGHKKGISSIAWSHDNQLLVSASYDKTLKIWDASKAKCLKTLTGHEQVAQYCSKVRSPRVKKFFEKSVYCVKFSPASDFILCGSDEYASLWNTHTGENMKTFKFHKDRVTAVDFDPNGNLMLTSSNDGYCLVYDTRADGIVHCIKESASISYAKFSRNGRYILAATLDSTIKIWNIDKGKYVKVYTGHKNRKYPLFADFTNGGKWIISGSEDNMVYVWDLNSKHLVQVLEGHSDKALCVDCHPNQNVIASGGFKNDKTVRIWKGRQKQS